MFLIKIESLFSILTQYNQIQPNNQLSHHHNIIMSVADDFEFIDENQQVEGDRTRNFSSMNENEQQDNNRTNNIRRRYIIEPLDTSTLNHKKYTKFTSLTLADLATDATDFKKRGYLDLQIIRMIANGRSGQQNKVRFYKAKDNSKKMSSVGYKRLFLLRVIRPDTGTTNLVYVIEDEINHCNMWNQFTSIRDNGGITIGYIIRFLSETI